MQDIYLCFKNNDNMDHIDIVNKTHFVNSLTDMLFNISYQLSSSFSKSDREDYLKNFFTDPIINQFIHSEFIDNSLFVEWLINELNNKFFEFFGIDIKSKELVYQELSKNEIIANIYYESYLKIGLNQSFIIKILYNIFSYLTTKQVENIENILSKKIEKRESKSISKKFKIKSNNYVMDLREIIKDAKTMKELILNTNLFDKHLQNTIYYNDEIKKDYLYEIFIRNSSKYEIATLFENLFKFEENIDICINNVEVYAISRNFELNRYGTIKD